MNKYTVFLYSSFIIKMNVSSVRHCFYSMSDRSELLLCSVLDISFVDIASGMRMGDLNSKDSFLDFLNTIGDNSGGSS